MCIIISIKYIISIDDYSSGSKKNHINDKRVKYLKGETKNISKTFERLQNLKENIISEICEEPDGSKSFYLKDPFDNILNFYYKYLS